MYIAENMGLQRITLFLGRAFMLAFLLLMGITFTDSTARSQEVEHKETGETALNYRVLAELLANDALRNRLVEELKQLASEESPALVGNGPNVSAEVEPVVPDSSSNRFFSAWQHFAYQLHFDVQDTWRVLKNVFSPHAAQTKLFERWHSVVLHLVIVIILTFGSYALSRRLTAKVGARLSEWHYRSPPMMKKEGAHAIRLRKILAVGAALVVDWSTVLGAALVGYVAVASLTSTSVASPGSFLVMQFLTAFLLVGTLNALNRAVFSTRYESLRLLPLDRESAGFWSRWLGCVVTVGGYGLLVLVPLLQVVLAPSLANVVGTVLALGLYLYVVGILWRKRVSVTAFVLSQAQQTDNAVWGTFLRIMARLWIWVAIGYLTALLVVIQLTHQNALGFMAQASAQTLLVLLIGGAMLLVLSTLTHHQLHLPDVWQRNFPLLEERLNSYIPTTLRVLRVVVLVVMSLCVFDAWRLFDLKEWLLSTHGQVVINTALRIAVVLVLAALGWTLLASMIEHRLASAGTKMPTEREKTLLMLFRNVLAIVIVTLSSLIILSQVGIDIGPLIAGAGVVGLAVGFGAQKLVQDVITGVFIQLENGMNQNDVVEVAGLFGVVEKLTIRSVVIRTLDGGYHLVPFSSIDCVANHTRDYGYHHGEYLVSLRESVDDVVEHMRAAFVDLKQDPEVADSILDDISIPGVTNLGSTGATIRVLIKTAPGMQWAVQRSFNRLLKLHFDAAGIEIPYPQTVVHFGRDKAGKAAPANIHMVDAVAQSQRAHTDLN